MQAKDNLICNQIKQQPREGKDLFLDFINNVSDEGTEAREF